MLQDCFQIDFTTNNTAGECGFPVATLDQSKVPVRISLIGAVLLQEEDGKSGAKKVSGVWKNSSDAQLRYN